MALERLLDRTGSQAPPEALYTHLHFPSPPEERPYIFVNMVSTADGKTLLGPPGSTALGLGSSTDQILMRRLQQQADAAIIGAETLRAGPVIYAPHLWRVVVTRRGELPLDNRFFTDAPEKAIVFAPATLPPEARDRLGTRATLRIVGEEVVDVGQLARILRTEFNIRILVLEGGASLNFAFFEAGLVDELFLTIAPKIKGGAHIPTVVDGPGLPNRQYIPLQLLSLYHDGDELYLRYRVQPRELPMNDE
jgi:riboflavin-specific deaminase-like protein